MNIALSALIEAAGRGDEIIIARNGEPVARLSSIAAWPRRRPGIRELYGLKGPPTPLEAFAPDPSFATRRRSANSGRFHRN